MAPNIVALDRLKAQLLTSGIQGRNNALFQVIDQLIDFLRQDINLTQSQIAALTPSGGQSTIVERFILAGLDGTDGLDAVGTQGKDGVAGPTGESGPPGVSMLANDGEDGQDGLNIPNPGPAGADGATGAQGPMGISVLPFDGIDGEMGWPGAPGAAGSGDGSTTTYKTTDETRHNNTIAADTDLVFAMDANSKYSFMLVVLFISTTAADFKFGNSGPAAATRVAIRRAHIPSGSVTQTNSVDNAYVASVTTASTSGEFGWVTMQGCITNGANTGNFAFTWAQNTTQAADDTTVLAGSWIRFKKVA